MHFPELPQQWRGEDEFQTHHPDFTSLQKSPKGTSPSALGSKYRSTFAACKCLHMCTHSLYFIHMFSVMFSVICRSLSSCMYACAFWPEVTKH